MKKTFLKILAITLVLILTVGLFACGEDDSNATRLSFKSASKYDYLKSLDGQKVTINGYIATSSPVDGSFIFLMNLPYQSCPFCVPNTSQLSNTIEVYPKAGSSFSYTTQAVKIVGTLMVAPSENQYFVDEYGYEFNYKIVNATYTVLKAEELGEEMALWQSIAESGIVNDIYSLYDYVNFLCCWNEYYVNTYVDASGNTVPGYYLYPNDAYYYVTTKGAQWNYGYSDGYFDGILSKIKGVDEEALSDLVKNIENAKELASEAFSELEYAYSVTQNEKDQDPSNDLTPNFTREYKYLESFGRYDYVYTLNKGSVLKDRLTNLFDEFSNWLGNWEM